jgi:hypothetical protein
VTGSWHAEGTLWFHLQGSSKHEIRVILGLTDSEDEGIMDLQNVWNQSCNNTASVSEDLNTSKKDQS